MPIAEYSQLELEFCLALGEHFPDRQLTMLTMTMQCQRQSNGNGQCHAMGHGMGMAHLCLILPGHGLANECHFGPGHVMPWQCKPMQVEFRVYFSKDSSFHFYFGRTFSTAACSVYVCSCITNINTIYTTLKVWWKENVKIKVWIN